MEVAHDCRELFEAWCEDPRNGIIIADFAVAGTLAREVLDEPKEIMSHSGHKVDARYVASVTCMDVSCICCLQEYSDDYCRCTGPGTLWSQLSIMPTAEC